jgi:alpha,alpha-trehalase
MDASSYQGAQGLPLALNHLDDLMTSAADKRIIVFLDYDGTLTPIVPRPEDANLSETMHNTIDALAHALPVAIVSGRDLHDVQRRVNIDQIYYAGSHGFDIAGPKGFHAEQPFAAPFLHDLDRAETDLQHQITSIAGAQVQRKRFAIAIHYRRVEPTQVAEVRTAVITVSSAFPNLRMTGGKKLFELRPSVDWHKGKALFWLIEVMGFDCHKCLPIYIGDDVTDEDAFQAIGTVGVGIVVSETLHVQTAARYRLADVNAVGSYLELLTNLHQQSDSK